MKLLGIGHMNIFYLIVEVKCGCEGENVSHSLTTVKQKFLLSETSDLWVIFVWKAREMIDVE